MYAFHLLLFELPPVIQRTLAPFTLGGIVLGVVARYLLDHYLNYVGAPVNTRVPWDWRGFFLTTVVSVPISIMMYGILFDQVRMLREDMLVFSVSAQGGFAWQSILGDLGKRVTKKS